MIKYSRKIFNFHVLLILLVMLPFGCSTAPQSSSNVKVGLENPVLQLTPFQEKILGHWITEKGKTHYYIDRGTMIMVDSGKAMKQKYSIYETNEAENFIRIQVVTEHNLGHKKLLKFSPDFKSISETLSIDVMGKVMEVSGKWNFVDATTSP